MQCRKGKQGVIMFYLTRDLQPDAAMGDVLPKFYYVCYLGDGQPKIVDGMCYTTLAEALCAIAAYDRMLSVPHTITANAIIIPGAFGYTRSLDIGWDWADERSIKAIRRIKEIKAITIR